MSVRDFPTQAGDAFGRLARETDYTIENARGSLSDEEVRGLKSTRGWALAHRGAEQLKSGDLSGAKESFEGSRAVYETDSEKPLQSDQPLNPILSDMYRGLGQTYHYIALKGGDDAKKYFEQAEGVFLPALEKHKAQFVQVEQASKTYKPEATNNPDIGNAFSFSVAENAKQVAASHLALARLYRDMDRRPQAARQLVELINFQKGRGDSDGLVAARKELAEFYRDQNLFLGAEKAYVELIDEQEARVGRAADYERRGPGLAESYNELAEVYRAQDTEEKRKKADDALAAATAIQRLAMRLRRIRAMRNSPDVDIKADSSDDLADAAADAYVKLGKARRALALYEYALGVREQGAGAIRRDLRKSYDKLTRLYRRADFKDFPKDFAKAERYNQLLIQEVAGDDPKNTKAAADAVALCAMLYAEDPNRHAEAAAYYERAMKLYESQPKRNWMTENTILYVLSELYEKLKRPAEQKRAALRRLDVLSAEMDKIVGLTGALPQGSITLVREYAEAARDAGYFHKRDRDDGGAASVYGKAFAAYDFVTKRIYFVPALKSYARLLDDYAALLDKQGGKDEAAKVAAAAKRVRLKQDETKNIQEQQAQQGVAQTSAGQ